VDLVMAQARPAAAGRAPADLVGRTPSPWIPVLVFLAVGALVWLVVWLSAAHLPRHGLYYPDPLDGAGGPAFEGWVRWDAFWYRGIVRDGYWYTPGVQSPVAFFPAYPLLVGAVGLVIPNVFVAGIVTTAACGLLATRALWTWLTARMSVRAATTTVVLFLVYPFSWYLFGAVYADALFLAAAIGAFAAVDRDRMWAAGLLGFVTSAARPTGVAVAVGLVLVTLERRNRARHLVASAVDATVDATVGAVRGTTIAAESADVSRRRRRWPLDPRGFTRRDAPVLVAFGGLGAYAAYLGVRFGHPLLFSEIQGVKGWDQPAGWSTWLKVPMWRKLAEAPTSDAAAMMVVQALLTLVALALVPRVARRFGWGYGAYVLVVVAVPVLGSKDFVGLGRYLLPAFPVVALLGEALSRRSALTRVLVLGASGAAMVTLASFFARGWYLS
jgi:hypothetical protein